MLTGGQRDVSDVHWDIPNVNKDIPGGQKDKADNQMDNHDIYEDISDDINLFIIWSYFNNEEQKFCVLGQLPSYALYCIANCTLL